MRRMLLLFSAVAFATLIIGAAGMVGRGSASPIAVVQTNMRASDFVTYALVDVDRRTTVARRLPVSAHVDGVWYMSPPLILQRVTRGEFADWTLNTVDVRRNTLSPVMRLTTLNNIRIRILDFIGRERSDGTMQYIVYVPHSGEIWTATPEQPDAVLVATGPRGLPFPMLPSPDGTMLAVASTGELLVVNSDGSNERIFEGLETRAWVTWSPDSRKLLVSPVDIYRRESARVVDVTTGELTVLDDVRLAISCGAGYVAITEEAGGFGVTRISEDGESSAILDPETLNGLEPAGIIQLERQRCDWLVILNRRNEGMLVQPGSGEMLLLGNDLRIIRADGGTMIYQTRTRNTIEVLELALAPGAQPRLLWQYPRNFTEVRWLDDGADRGLSVESGRLTLIDRDGQSVIPLDGARAQFYSLLEE